MIRVPRIEEPPHFQQQVREPGHRWLDERLRPWAQGGCHPPQPDFPPHWTQVTDDLRGASAGRCSYMALYIATGQVDHHRCRADYPDLAYDWDNFCYADANLNSRKGAHEVLNPFEVEDGWFEILLPSLELVLTDHVPVSRRVVAERTLGKLLRNKRVERLRQDWYQEFWDGELNLPNLHRKDPLCARAVDSRLGAVVTRHATAHADELPDTSLDRNAIKAMRRRYVLTRTCETCRALRCFQGGSWTLATLRCEAPRVAALLEGALQAEPAAG